MVVQGLEAPTECKPDNPIKDKIVSTKRAKPIDPEMDLGLDRELQKIAELVKRFATRRARLERIQ